MSFFIVLRACYEWSVDNVCMCVLQNYNLYDFVGYAKCVKYGPDIKMISNLWVYSH